MKRLRPRLTFANVVSCLALFVALGSGAVAASQLGKNTVGPKQLKKNAVTTKKIKKNAVTTAKIKKDAVTTAKIKNGAVDGAKVMDGSLTGGDVNAATMPFSRVVAKARGSATVDVPTTGFVLYPLENATYTQAANEDDDFIGAVDVTFQSSCMGSRQVQAFVLLDTNPAAPSENDIVALGEVQLTDPGTVTRRIEMRGLVSRFEPGTAKSHTITVGLTANCTTGSGITATFGGVDVIGTTS